MEKSAPITTPAAAASPHTAPPAYLPQETGAQALVPTSTPGDDIHAASAPRDPAASPAPHPQQGDQKQMDPMNMNPAPVPLVTPIEMLAGESPQYIDCPWCHQRALTTTRREGTSMQMITGLICCLICVCLACLPCIAGWFEETIYSCSACKKMVAKRDDNGHIQVLGPPVLVPSNMPPAQGVQPPQPVHK